MDEKKEDSLNAIVAQPKAVSSARRWPILGLVLIKVAFGQVSWLERRRLSYLSASEIHWAAMRAKN